MANRPKCDTCAAWDQNYHMARKDTGICRRAPPMNGRDTRGANDPLWPITHRTDWCLAWIAALELLTGA